jgi:addiction module RelB/DinJ family antitoxin
MKTTTSIKLDQDIKDQASKLASDLGLNLSSVINATLKQFVTERRIVFSKAPEFNVKTKKEFLEMVTDIKKGKNLAGPFGNVKELKKSLLS